MLQRVRRDLYRTGGGLEKEEVEKAIEIGAKPITLGKRILRTETAGMALLSIMMFQLQK